MLNHILRWLGIGPEEAFEDKKRIPVVIPRAKHGISRTNISKAALKVLYRLRDAGYQAYLVGGGVRDVLLERHPKDFDVATNARPDQVQKLFQNCRLIGRRFRLAHVHFGANIVEVATFRASSSSAEETNPHLVHSEAGMILRDNVYGTIEDDVFRRDFTINALYYNIADFTLIDYVGGLKDLETSCIRMIGDAGQRYREDPVRMLRAIRFAAKLDFYISPETEQPILELGYLVKQVPSARLLDEFMKLFLSGHAEASFQLLRRYKLFGILFPQTEACLNGPQGTQVEHFIKSALLDTDKRVFEHKPVALPFLLAAFLWYPLQSHLETMKESGLAEVAAFYEACDLALNEQQRSVAISRRLIQAIREIWILQIRLTKRTGKRPLQLCIHPKFRAAYDFLLLRANSADPGVQELANWWQEYIAADDVVKMQMTKALKKESTRYRRRTKKRL